MNIQKFKSIKQLIAKKVDMIQEIEQDNKLAYYKISKGILEALLCTSIIDTKALLLGKKKNEEKEKSFIYDIDETIKSTKLLITACDIQYKELLKLNREKLLDRQKNDILELHHKLKPIVLDLETTQTFLLEKAVLVEELLGTENISREKINVLIEQFYQELKGTG